MTLAPLLFALAVTAGEDAPKTIDFSRDVRPIFEARCLECHGPKKQKGKLRLDRRETVFSPDTGEARVIPGKPAESPLFHRVSLPADDPDVMPAEGPPLEPSQIALIEKWIVEGAAWADAAAPEAGGAKPTPAADKEPLRPEPPIALAPIDPAAAARVESAIAAIRKRGAAASRIAQDTEAVDANFSLLGSKGTDADLALLAGLEPRLVWLDLARTSITDGGLAAIRGCGELRRLSLAGTPIGDAGLDHLGKLEKLESLNLFGTAITDAGLAKLEGRRELKRLFLWRTAVTDAGVERLRAALPGLSIDRGGYAEEMAKIAPPPPAAVNNVCPISGKPIQPGFVVVHEGKTIGFCCGDCLAKFQANPAAYPLK